VVAGAIAGGLVTAAEDADINEITKTISMEKLVEQMEAKGFEVTVEGDAITAYKEGLGKTITITIDCPDGECQFQKPESPEGTGKCGMDKKRHFRFKMHGKVDMAAVKAKMADMGYDTEAIKAKMAGMAKEGFEGCPFAEGAE
jgi:hypothetical protein